MSGIGSYVGDQAQVLPSNTEALLHFSNMFAELEHQREAEKLAQQKMDLQRQHNISTYTGSKTNPKDYYTNADYGTYVQKGLDDMSNTANQMSKAGVSAADVQNYLNQASADLHMKSQRVKAMQDNITAGVAGLMKKYPNMDPAALLHFTAHDTYYDKDGNLVPPEQLDPTQSVVQKAFVQHYPDLFPANSGAEDLNQRLQKAKLNDNKMPSKLNPANGDITSMGYETKLPDFATVGQDNNGKYTAQAISQNYRLPGSTHDYVDNNGQNVKVVPDNIFKQYYNGAIGANIESQVRQDLKTPIQTDHGKVTLGPDSEYANMLRKKYLYDALNGAAGRYPVNPDPNAQKNSLQIKNAIWRKQFEQANLGIRQQENARSADRFAWEKEKAAAKESGKEAPLTDYYENNAAKEFPSMPGVPDISGTTGIKIINLKDIKPEDLKTITGNNYTVEGADANYKNIQPYKAPDGSEYFTIKDGQWYGSNGPIDMSAAYKRQTNSYNKAEKSKNVFQRASNAVKGFFGSAPVIK